MAAAARRLSAPGVEGGATLGLNRVLFQGLFNAPQVVGESLKGACLVAHVMEAKSSREMARRDPQQGRLHRRQSMFGLPRKRTR